jgi:thioredoxin reductase
MTQTDSFEVIIIGGSFAGLSAAMILGRSLKKVLVIDSGKPCNRQTPHSHSFLTRDGETPAQIAAIAREQVLAYPTVNFLQATATNAQQNPDGFIVETNTGLAFHARKLLLATGVEDIMPDIEGFAACWGRSVLHCPYCHGYEVHGQRLGILANGDSAYEMARHIQNWSKSLTVFTNGPSLLTLEQQQVLLALGIQIIDDELVAIKHQDGMLQSLVFKTGTTHPLTALFSRVPFRQHSNLAEQLGCELTDTGLVKASEFGQTNVPGLYASGDNSTFMRQVAMAVANGGKAGVAINRELIEDELRIRLYQSA